MPALTATVTTRTNENGDAESLLRYHPIQDSREPEDIPTLIVHRLGDEQTPVFAALQAMIEQVGTRALRSRFPIRRAGKYSRPDIPRFVDTLKHVCNHSVYGPSDRQFNATLTHANFRYATGELTPGRVDEILEGHHRTNNLRVDCNFVDDVLALSNGDANVSAAQPVTKKHLFGCFALMTWERSVVLVVNEKPWWTHDVPGGKVTVADRSVHDTLRREIFEELGMTIEADRIEGPLGSVYDPQSAKEDGCPVVAEYYHYPLSPGEHSYLVDVAAGTTTREHPLVLYPLDTLLEKKRRNTDGKEPVCHASRAVINRLVNQLAAGSSTGGEARCR
jgi:8-oxo-dGTP pyrophosphatase MutT (NUDIX family)